MSEEPYDYKDEWILPDLTPEEEQACVMRMLAAMDQMTAAFRDMKDADGECLFEEVAYR